MKLIDLKHPANAPAKKKLRSNSEERRERRTKMTMRQWVAYSLLAIFIFNTLSVTTIIYLHGFGLVVLSSSIIFTLIGETVAQCAAMFAFVVRKLFSD